MAPRRGWTTRAVAARQTQALGCVVIVRGVSPLLWRILKLALFLSVLVYVARVLVTRIAQVPLGEGALDYGYLLAGGLVAAVSSVLFAPIYLAMQEALGSAAGVRAATVVALISPVGKYLPGKVGSLVGAIWIYRAFGVGAIVATGVTLLSAATTFAAVSLLLIPFLAFGDLGRLPSDLLRWLCLGVWFGGLVLAFPRLFLALVNRVMALTGRAPLELPIRYGPYLRGVAWTALQCLVMGAAFWLVARAAAPVAGGDWYLFTASLLVAGVVGFFAFFAPAGIGVREGLLLALLHGSIADPALALAVVLLRANQVVIEVVFALLGWVLWRWLPPVERQAGRSSTRPLVPGGDQGTHHD
jgi:glycosyltransferase 2 family protein